MRLRDINEKTTIISKSNFGSFDNWTGKFWTEFSNEIKHFEKEGRAKVLTDVKKRIKILDDDLFSQLLKFDKSIDVNGITFDGIMSGKIKNDKLVMVLYILDKVLEEFLKNKKKEMKILEDEINELYKVSRMK